MNMTMEILHLWRRLHTRIYHLKHLRKAIEFELKVLAIEVKCQIYLMERRRKNAKARVKPMHYAKVVKTRFEVVNFDKLILHQFSTKMGQIFNDGVKTSKFLKK